MDKKNLLQISYWFMAAIALVNVIVICCVANSESRIELYLTAIVLMIAMILAKIEIIEMNKVK